MVCLVRGSFLPFRKEVASCYPRLSVEATRFRDVELSGYVSSNVSFRSPFIQSQVLNVDLRAAEEPDRTAY
jgi:hypothetical protein